MPAFCLARFPLEVDLSPLHQALTRHGVTHRLTEEQGQQVLWLLDIHQRETAEHWVQQFLSGNIGASASPAFADTKNALRSPLAVGAVLFDAPVTWLFMILGGLGFLAVQLPILPIYTFMTFVPIQIFGEHAMVTPWSWMDFWRLLTPVFLHFGIWHIVLNAVAMVQIGTALERIWGYKYYLVICLITGISGNVLQYTWTHSPMFGGLSGIIFGLFSFNGVVQWLRPERAFPLPVGFYLLLLAWLIAGFTPIFQVAFGVQMGNGAHLAGAISGIILALVRMGPAKL
jgi:GlpG protein